MPSDTVWVAMIGGGVTVASLSVQGWLSRGTEKRRNEREDRQRIEDRTWSVREHNRERRRDVYADLLEAAEGIIRSLRALSWHFEESTPRQEGIEAANAVGLD